jgi:AraC-like DNA-binding protein
MFAIGRATILHPYLDFARQIGIPWETELERCRLPLRSDKNFDSWLPYSRIEDFIEAMVHREPDIVSPLCSFAVDPSRSLHPAMWVPLSNCGSLLRALEKLEELALNHVTDFKSDLEIQNETAIFKFWTPTSVGTKIAGFTVQEARSCELSINIIRRFCGDGVQVKRMFLRSQSPQVVSALKHELGDIPVETNSSFSGVEFSRRYLSAIVPPTGTTQAIEGNIDFDGDLSWKLSECLTSYIGELRPDLAFAAELVGISPRTLQRRLAEVGTSYQEILASARFRKALTMITEDHDLKSIALTLGYSEQSAFCRAFRDWAGVPPSEYRMFHEKPGIPI